MHYIIETLSEVPVVVSRILPGYNVAAEIHGLHEEVRSHLDVATEAMFYIVDTTQVSFDFGAILNVSNTGAREDNSAWRHPNVRQVIFISDLEIVHRGVAGLDSTAFGNFKALVFNTMDEALDHIRTVNKVR